VLSKMAPSIASGSLAGDRAPLPLSTTQRIPPSACRTRYSRT
jgi:hypothetical protein